MRIGFEVQDACSKGIQRLLQLKTSDESLEKMHPKLVAGVVAMDKNGNIGAASTLDPSNLHRGEPFFPVACWRENDICNHDEYHVLEASVSGARY
jgi:hypothetical protein